MVNILHIKNKKRKYLSSTMGTMKVKKDRISKKKKKNSIQYKLLNQ